MYKVGTKVETTDEYFERFHKRLTGVIIEELPEDTTTGKVYQIKFECGHKTHLNEYWLQAQPNLRHFHKCPACGHKLKTCHYCGEPV